MKHRQALNIVIKFLDKNQSNLEFDYEVKQAINLLRTRAFLSEKNRETYKKTKRARSIDSAMRKSKNLYEKACIFTGRVDDVDGAHLFDRSTHPEIADDADNIFPMTRKNHVNFFGEKSNLEQRVSYLFCLIESTQNPKIKKEIESQLKRILEKTNNISVYEKIKSEKDRNKFLVFSPTL